MTKRLFFAALALLHAPIGGGCGCSEPNGTMPPDAAVDGGPDGPAPGDGGVAPPAELDSSFGDGGIVSLASDWSLDILYAATRTTDGGFLLAGTTADFAPRSQALVLKLDADGSLDSSFGTDGVALVVVGEQARATALVELADGSVVIAGAARLINEPYYYLARLTVDGELDDSFGQGGVSLWDGDFQNRVYLAQAMDDGFWVFDGNLHSFDAAGVRDGAFADEEGLELTGREPRGLAERAGGGLLLLSSDFGGTGVLHATTAAGALDASFAAAGTYAIDRDVFSVAVDPTSGAIFVGGGGDSSALLKLTPDGAPDSTFGTDGAVGLGLDSDPIAIVVRDNGELYVVDGGGIGTSWTSRDIVRLDAAGAGLPFAVPHSFTSGGFARLIVDGAGIVMVDTERVIPADNPARDSREGLLLAMGFDGTLNTSFGADGIVNAASRAAPEFPLAAGRRSDGATQVLAFGATSTLFVAADEDGPLAGFGTGGFADLGYPSPNTGGFVLDADDRAMVLVSGAYLWRYDAAGARDMTFGDGTLVSPFLNAGLNGVARSVGVDAMGRFLLPGLATDPVVVRTLADGAADTTFGTAGAFTLAPTSLSQPPDSFVFLELDSMGRVVVVGQTLAGFIVVARLDTTGALDPTFGTGGVVETTISGLTQGPIRERPGGGYFTAFHSPRSEGGVLGVIAFEPDGTLDPAFGMEGLLEMPVAETLSPPGFLPRPDGSLVLLGAVAAERFEQLAVWKVDSTGALVTTFGTNGVVVIPGPGRATSVLDDCDGFLVVGTRFDPRSGSDVVLLRFRD